MCQQIFKDGKCVDGCGFDEVCQISVMVGVLLCWVYGFGLFQCGFIQVFLIVILGIFSDVQEMDDFYFNIEKLYLYYYNFFFYFVGEMWLMCFFGCCEIGYGVLVECVIFLVFFEKDIFFYVVCVVSEVFSFNGFILMGFVCGSILLLMDVGVLLKVLVSGVVMGLIKEGDEVWIFIDI